LLAKKEWYFDILIWTFEERREEDEIVILLRIMMG